MKHFKVCFHTANDAAEFSKEYLASSKIAAKEKFLHDICQTSFLLIYFIDCITQID